MKRPTRKLVTAVSALSLAAAVPFAGSADAAGGSFNCYTNAITTRSVSTVSAWHTHIVNGVGYTAYFAGSNTWDVAWANHSGTWNATPNGSYRCRAGS